MARASLHALALLSLLAGAAGCDMTTGAAPRSTAVAVIDLDAIAARLGSDKQITASLSQREQALRSQLVELAKNYQQQIAAKQQEAVDAPKQEEGVQLASFQEQVQTEFNRVKLQAQANLSAHQAELVNQFREHVRPAARRVANQRGMSLIVTKNDSVIYDMSDSVDITEAVIAELSAAPAPTP